MTALETVQMATHAFAASIENMCIDHATVLYSVPVGVIFMLKIAFNETRFLFLCLLQDVRITPLGVEDNREERRRRKKYRIFNEKFQISKGRVNYIAFLLNGR